MDTNTGTKGTAGRRRDSGPEDPAPLNWSVLLPGALCLGVGAIAALVAVLA